MLINGIRKRCRIHGGIVHMNLLSGREKFWVFPGQEVYANFQKDASLQKRLKALSP